MDETKKKYKLHQSELLTHDTPLLVSCRTVVPGGWLYTTVGPSVATTFVSDPSVEIEE